MSEIVLVLRRIGQFVVGAVTQHVAVDKERDVGSSG
jgi:hypothetical protein